MSSALLLLFFFSVVVRFGASKFLPPDIETLKSPSRSLLRAINDPDPVDAAVDLNITNFDQVLRESPTSFAIVEFFANWCPACRNYKPHYEKVARLFNGRDAVHPGIVLMTRVDCALKINNKLCDRFSVGHYPMLLWGPPSKFASGGWKPQQENSVIKSIDDGRTAERLLKWINKQIHSEFSLEDEKYENEHQLLPNASDPEQVTRAVYDVEEATAEAFDIILEHKMIKSEARGPLVRFLQILVAHHPSRRCRRGSADILVNFDYLWPSDLWSVGTQEAVVAHEKDALNSLQICGKEVPRGYWVVWFSALIGTGLHESHSDALISDGIFCRGSKNETRGFSCGLWLLLHSLSVRVEDGESHYAFTATCEFIHNFFICEECRRHFYEMCSSVSTPLDTMRDFAMWLWNAHNKVNERLMKEEAALRTGDPKYPKMIWPPKQLCPSCYLSPPVRFNGTIRVDWNKEEVFKFLVGYYGKMLVSSFKEYADTETDSSKFDSVAISTTGLSSTVPFGAAIGIALACCAFGVCACLWRSRQKSRKYLHQLHSLKNI